MSAEQAIATVNITAEEFRWYDVCCHLFEWFAQGDTNRKGYDIVQDVYDFMSEAESRNVTGQDAWMEEVAMEQYQGLLPIEEPFAAMTHLTAVAL